MKKVILIVCAIVLVLAALGTAAYFVLPGLLNPSQDDTTATGDLKVDTLGIMPFAYMGEEFDLMQVIIPEEGVTYSATAGYVDTKTFTEYSLEVKDMMFTPVDQFEVFVVITATRGSQTASKMIYIPVTVRAEPLDDLYKSSGALGGSDAGVAKKINIDPNFLYGDTSKTSLKVEYSGTMSHPWGTTFLNLSSPDAQQYFTDKVWDNAVITFWVYNPMDLAIEFQPVIVDEQKGTYDDWSQYEGPHSQKALPGQWTQIRFSLRALGVKRIFTSSTYVKDMMLMKMRYDGYSTTEDFYFEFYMDNLDVQPGSMHPDLDTRYTESDETLEQGWENMSIDSGWSGGRFLYSYEYMKGEGSECSLELRFSADHYKAKPWIAFSPEGEGLTDELDMTGGTLEGYFYFENCDPYVALSLTNGKWASSNTVPFELEDLGDGWYYGIIDLEKLEVGNGRNNDIVRFRLHYQNVNENSIVRVDTLKFNYKYVEKVLESIDADWINLNADKGDYYYNVQSSYDTTKIKGSNTVRSLKLVAPADKVGKYTFNPSSSIGDEGLAKEPNLSKGTLSAWFYFGDQIPSASIWLTNDKWHVSAHVPMVFTKNAGNGWYFGEIHGSSITYADATQNSDVTYRITLDIPAGYTVYVDNLHWTPGTEKELVSADVPVITYPNPPAVDDLLGQMTLTGGKLQNTVTNGKDKAWQLTDRLGTEHNWLYPSFDLGKIYNIKGYKLVFDIKVEGVTSGRVGLATIDGTWISGVTANGQQNFSLTDHIGQWSTVEMMIDQNSDGIKQMQKFGLAIEIKDDGDGIYAVYIDNVRLVPYETVDQDWINVKVDVGECVRVEYEFIENMLKDKGSIHSLKITNTSDTGIAEYTFNVAAQFNKAYDMSTGTLSGWFYFGDQDPVLQLRLYSGKSWNAGYAAFEFDEGQDGWYFGTVEMPFVTYSVAGANSTATNRFEFLIPAGYTIIVDGLKYAPDAETDVPVTTVPETTDPNHIPEDLLDAANSLNFGTMQDDVTLGSTYAWSFDQFDVSLPDHKWIYPEITFDKGYEIEGKYLVFEIMIEGVKDGTMVTIGTLNGKWVSGILVNNSDKNESLKNGQWKQIVMKLDGNTHADGAITVMESLSIAICVADKGAGDFTVYIDNMILTDEVPEPTPTEPAPTDPDATAPEDAEDLLDAAINLSHGALQTEITNNSTKSWKLDNESAPREQAHNWVYTTVTLDHEYDITGKVLVFEIKSVNLDRLRVGISTLNGEWGCSVDVNGSVESPTIPCEDWTRVVAKIGENAKGFTNVTKIGLGFEITDADGVYEFYVDNFKLVDPDDLNTTEPETTEPETTEPETTEPEYTAEDLLDAATNLNAGALQTDVTLNSTKSWKVAHTDVTLPDHKWIYPTITFDQGYDITGKYLVFDMMIEGVNNGTMVTVGTLNGEWISGVLVNDSTNNYTLDNGKWAQVIMQLDQNTDGITVMEKLSIAVCVAEDGDGVFNVYFDNMKLVDEYPTEPDTTAPESTEPAYVAEDLLDAAVALNHGALQTDVTNNSTKSWKLDNVSAARPDHNWLYTGIELDQEYDITGKVLVFDIKSVNLDKVRVGISTMDGTWVSNVDVNGSTESPTIPCEEWTRVVAKIAENTNGITKVTKIGLGLQIIDADDSFELYIDNFKLMDPEDLETTEPETTEPETTEPETTEPETTVPTDLNDLLAGARPADERGFFNPNDATLSYNSNATVVTGEGSIKSWSFTGNGEATGWPIAMIDLQQSVNMTGKILAFDVKFEGARGYVGVVGLSNSNWSSCHDASWPPNFTVSDLDEDEWNTVYFDIEAKLGAGKSYDDVKFITFIFDMDTNAGTERTVYIDNLRLVDEIPSEPDTTEPDSTEPDSTEPDSTEPDSSEPQTTVPAVTDLLDAVNNISYDNRHWENYGETSEDWFTGLTIGTETTVVSTGSDRSWYFKASATAAPVNGTSSMEAITAQFNIGTRDITGYSLAFDVKFVSEDATSQKMSVSLDNSGWAAVTTAMSFAVEPGEWQTVVFNPADYMVAGKDLTEVMLISFKFNFEDNKGTDRAVYIDNLRLVGKESTTDDLSNMILDSGMCRLDSYYLTTEKSYTADKHSFKISGNDAQTKVVFSTEVASGKGLIPVMSTMEGYFGGYFYFGEQTPYATFVAWDGWYNSTPVELTFVDKGEGWYLGYVCVDDLVYAADVSTTNIIRLELNFNANVTVYLDELTVQAESFVPSEPDSTEPDSTEPDSTEPETTEPETTEPETTEPETTEPETTEPETTVPTDLNDLLAGATPADERGFHNPNDATLSYNSNSAVVNGEGSIKSWSFTGSESASGWPLAMINLQQSVNMTGKYLAMDVKFENARGYIGIVGLADSNWSSCHDSDWPPQYTVADLATDGWTTVYFDLASKVGTGKTLDDVKFITFIFDMDTNVGTERTIYIDNVRLVDEIPTEPETTEPETTEPETTEPATESTAPTTEAEDDLLNLLTSANGALQTEVTNNSPTAFKFNGTETSWQYVYFTMDKAYDITGYKLVMDVKVVNADSAVLAFEGFNGGWGSNGVTVNKVTNMGFENRIGQWVPVNVMLDANTAGITEVTSFRLAFNIADAEKDYEIYIDNMHLVPYETSEEDWIQLRVDSGECKNIQYSIDRQTLKAENSVESLKLVNTSVDSSAEYCMSPEAEFGSTIDMTEGILSGWFYFGDQTPSLKVKIISNWRSGYVDFSFGEGENGWYYGTAEMKDVVYSEAGANSSKVNRIELIIPAAYTIYVDGLMYDADAEPVTTVPETTVAPEIPDLLDAAAAVSATNLPSGAMQSEVTNNSSEAWKVDPATGWSYPKVVLDKEYDLSGYALMMDVKTVNMDNFRINLSCINGEWVNGAKTNGFASYYPEDITAWTTLTILIDENDKGITKMSNFSLGVEVTDADGEYELYIDNVRLVRYEGVDEDLIFMNKDSGMCENVTFEITDEKVYGTESINSLKLVAGEGQGKYTLNPQSQYGAAIDMSKGVLGAWFYFGDQTPEAVLGMTHGSWAGSIDKAFTFGENNDGWYYGIVELPLVEWSASTANAASVIRYTVKIPAGYTVYIDCLKHDPSVYVEIPDLLDKAPAPFAYGTLQSNVTNGSSNAWMIDETFMTIPNHQYLYPSIAFDKGYNIQGMKLVFDVRIEGVTSATISYATLNGKWISGAKINSTNRVTLTAGEWKEISILFDGYTFQNGDPAVTEMTSVGFDFFVNDDGDGAYKLYFDNMRLVGYETVEQDLTNMKIDSGMCNNVTYKITDEKVYGTESNTSLKLVAGDNQGHYTFNPQSEYGSAGMNMSTGTLGAWFYFGDQTPEAHVRFTHSSWAGGPDVAFTFGENNNGWYYGTIDLTTVSWFAEQTSATTAEIIRFTVKIPANYTVYIDCLTIEQ